MRKYKIFIFPIAFFLLLISACTNYAADSEITAAKPFAEDNNIAESDDISVTKVLIKSENGDLGMEHFTMENGKRVYYYIPESVKNSSEERVPLVLFMCGTTCDPVDDCINSGWTELAEKENFVVISPDYNNYATYSETGFLISVVEYMIGNYSIDTERIYSTGFSNGGAASVALTRDYPQYFAAISAMGWMIDLDNKNGIFEKYDMPFQVIQGDGEFTEKTEAGTIRVMNDEVDGIRSMMLYNEMISQDYTPDYEKTPYWGYAPDETQKLFLNNRECDICSYFKEGYSSPFAQLIIVEDSNHRPRPEEAEFAWDFFKNFKRVNGGKIIEENKINQKISE